MKALTPLLPLLVVTGLSSLPVQGWARDVQLRDRPVSSDSTPPATAVRRVDTSRMSNEDRLRRLERMLESQGLVGLMVQLQELQQELQTLRGEVELQTHTLEELKKRQRELYVDIDRRLLSVERNGGARRPAPVVSAPVQAPIVAPVTPPTPVTTTSPVPTTSRTTPATPLTAAQSKDEQKAYQKSFDLLRALRYDKAIDSFREFIRLYPNGRYAHIAQYWIGEANYAQRRFADAIVDYQALLDNYSNSPKLAEAMLKIGYSQFELKQYDQARDSLERLIKAYPGTTESGQGQNLLQKIKLLQSSPAT